MTYKHTDWGSKKRVRKAEYIHRVPVEAGTRAYQARHNYYIGNIWEATEMLAALEPLLNKYEKKLYIAESQHNPLRKFIIVGLLVVSLLNMTTATVLSQYTKTVL